MVAHQCDVVHRYILFLTAGAGGCSVKLHTAEERFFALRKGGTSMERLNDATDIARTTIRTSDKLALAGLLCLGFARLVRLYETRAQ